MISIDGLAVEFSGTTLFSDISFVINEKDRIALMGKNGAGKSTLLKILAGVRQPTRGKVSAPKDCVVAYLPQHLMTEDGRTVFAETAQAFAHLHEMEARIDALNKELAEKGGALIGVNTFTLDGDEAAISEAKDVLAKKGAAYQNVYFDSDGEAGKFTANIFAYPTTYVIDRNGNIVGEPIVGAITEKNQAETLQSLIDQALAADMG